MCSFMSLPLVSIGNNELAKAASNAAVMYIIIDVVNDDLSNTLIKKRNKLHFLTMLKL